MGTELFALIAINRDAIATNRGFYYQYLSVALKWVNNYVSNDQSDVYTEVDDDVKEVGESIVFTQLKCYTSAFTFNSPEICKALLNFYSLYLQHHDKVEELRFNFSTNTSIGKSEKLLRRWVIEQPPSQNELLNLCTTRVTTILLKEVKKIRDNRLNSAKLSQTEKQSLTNSFNDLNELLKDKQLTENFVRRIRWEFTEQVPEHAIKELLLRITEQLGNPKFGARPVKLLLEAILSEIYRKSQLAEPEQRKVNNAGLKTLLEAKDEELRAYIDIRLISLLDMRFDLIENALNDLKEAITETANTQKQQRELLDELIRQKVKGYKEVPRLITRIPFFAPSTIIGRTNTLDDMHNLLLETHRVCINGNGGIGKSTMLKYYLNTYENEYDHLIWLNSESGLTNSISLNPEIGESLDLPIEIEKYAERFSLILSRLKDIPGKNLLVIDGYQIPESQLEELRSLGNWWILIGTRLRLSGWETITIGALDFEDAKSLYTSILSQSFVDEKELRAFFEQVEYNTLTIGLVAKTILHSLDLSLGEVMAHFEQQNLDSNDLQINLPNEYGDSPRLLNILKATFDLGALDNVERYFMMFFAQLPLQETDIMDLVEWYGKKKEAENKMHITNVVNMLHSKGLLERSGRRISMHRMLQRMILYQERQENSPFISQFYHIAELISRLREGADHDINQALRYLKYGESYLANIKEEFRDWIYDSMIKLENEVLNIYNWLHIDVHLAERWESLFNRAQKALPEGHPLIGIIANNYGLSLVSEYNLEKAMSCFDLASEILESQKEETIPQLLISLCNLCHLFIKRKEMTRFSECFDKIEMVRKKHDIWDDVSLPLQASILAIANYEFQRYERAIEMFNFAINLHFELPPNKRNDLQLISYIIHLTKCYLLIGLVDKAEKTTIYATNVLSKIQAQDTVYFPEIIKLMIAICNHRGDQVKAKQLMETLKDLGYDEID